MSTIPFHDAARSESFACCYGKPCSECSGLARKLVGARAFVFSGKTKKIAYESGFDGVPVVPVQAMTAVVNTSVGLVGMLLFLNSYYSAALILSLVVSQLWRLWSETLRADYRGEGRISAYQIMALLSILFVMGLAYILPVEAGSQPGLATRFGRGSGFPLGPRGDPVPSGHRNRHIPVLRSQHYDRLDHVIPRL